MALSPPMSDRRRTDRRTNAAVPEPLERKRDRRAEDRRDSWRRVTKLTVVVGTSRQSVDAELGLGGASFSPTRPFTERTVVLELSVGPTTTLSLPAQVTRVAQRTHVRFEALDTKTELALARWLDAVD